MHVWAQTSGHSCIQAAVATIKTTQGRCIDVTVPNYVSRALTKYQHCPPKHPQYATHKWNKPAYGNKT
eukprot:13332193-Ditylum_brightwellii.AAC.2